mmetsp:Transcript_3080/g.7050  ORF Transcript_3080/g.7050 Transcript_3080/m.7050 type:complete len:298 (-) Transcript_3080:35-928(-)
MHTGSVPVALDDGLRVKGAVDLEVFADTLQDVSRHHKLVTSVDSDAWSDLVFLLSRHNFSVDSRDVDSGIKAGLVQRVGDGASEVVFGSNGTVVRSLRAAGHTGFGPSKRSAFVQVEEGEFLFESEPSFFVFVSLEKLFGVSTAVGRKGFSSRGVGIAHDQDVGLSVTSWAERITEDTLRLQDDFGIITGGLVGGGTIEVPLREVFDGFTLSSRQSAGLGSGVTDGINPNVFGQDVVFGERKGVVSGNNGRVQTGLSGNLSEDGIQSRTLLRGGDRGKCHGGRGTGKSDDGGGELHG